MNHRFLAIICHIIAEQGEAILGDPARLKGFIADYASRESRAERIVFGRCIEYGAYTELKDAEDREAAKAVIARRINANEGIELALCNNALDALEAALFGGAKPKKALCLKCGRELRDDQTECPFCETENATPQPEQPPKFIVPKSLPPTTVPWGSKPIPSNTSYTSGQALGTQPAVKKHTGRNLLWVVITIGIVIAIMIVCILFTVEIH